VNLLQSSYLPSAFHFNCALFECFYNDLMPAGGAPCNTGKGAPPWHRAILRMNLGINLKNGFTLFCVAREDSRW